ncbi:MAG: DUF937 domain-containing protein [Catenulispora sp.]|nr:DUF937 domain-containing protein [Catenulispora sp.]
MADTPDLSKLWKQLTDTVGGSVTDVFNKLKNSSIGDQVQSWIGKGENKPVTADQVTQALGQEHMERIAQKTGTTPEQAAQNMAAKLPTMVDKLTPDGQLPDPQTIKANMAGSKAAPKRPQTTRVATPPNPTASATTGPMRTQPTQPTPRPPHSM